MHLVASNQFKLIHFLIRFHRHAIEMFQRAAYRNLGALNQAFTSEANLTGFADHQMIMNGDTNGIGS